MNSFTDEHYFFCYSRISISHEIRWSGVQGKIFVSTSIFAHTQNLKSNIIFNEMTAPEILKN